MLRCTLQSLAPLLFTSLLPSLFLGTGCVSSRSATSTSGFPTANRSDCCATPLGASQGAAAKEPAPSAEPKDVSRFTVTEWIQPAERTKRLPGELCFTTQSGKKIQLEELLGRPLALSFFYTRCDNPRKCPLVVRTIAQLQQALAEAGLSRQVRLLLVTYDPEQDSPPVLAKFGTAHGLRFDEDVMMLQPDLKHKARLLKELNVGVNYDGQSVNVHSLRLMLFDAQGRFVRSYDRILWHNQQVLRDLERLLSETSLSH